MFKNIKKITFFLVLIFSLCFMNVYATESKPENEEEIIIEEITHKITKDDINSLDLNTTSKTKLKTILKEFGIENLTSKDNLYNIEFIELNEELISITLVFKDNIPIKIYSCKEEIIDIEGEQVSQKIEEKFNENLVKYILNESKLKDDYNTKNKELESKIEELTNEMSKNKNLTIGVGIVCIVMLITIIGIVIGTHSTKTQNNELLTEIELVENNMKELEDKNKSLVNSLKKRDEVINTLKEKVDSSNEYSNKLTQCITKLNKDLENEKIKYQNTLDNFSSIHEQDLITIGNAHQSEVKTLKEDYETKIKELEENNKALQKVISKYNKE